VQSCLFQIPDGNVVSFGNASLGMRLETLERFVHLKICDQL